MSSIAIRLTGLLLVVSLPACAGRTGPMQLADPRLEYAPREDQALVIFMRPWTMGFAVQSSVFELAEAGDEFVGIVPAKRKVAHYVDPGEHMFMVIGESADFLRAEVDAGKTYYVLVAPRIGVWKARFALKPVRSEKLDNGEVEGWLETCSYVVSTDEARRWAAENAERIQEKRSKYLPKWQGKDQKARNKATLFASDGR